MRIILTVPFLLFGCAGDTTDSTDTSQAATTENVIDPEDYTGGCGQVQYQDFTIATKVVDQDREPVAGALVILEERNWEPGQQYATGVTDEEGVVSLTGSQLIIFPNCWGTAQQYYLVASADELWGDRPLNAELKRGFEAGDFDLQSVNEIQIKPPETTR